MEEEKNQTEQNGELGGNDKYGRWYKFCLKRDSQFLYLLAWNPTPLSHQNEPTLVSHITPCAIPE